MEEDRGLWCKVGRYGLDKMENRRLQNTYCMEHAARTCCDKDDTDRLRGMYETLRQKTDISPDCLKLMDNAICSHCDPDMVSQAPTSFSLPTHGSSSCITFARALASTMASARTTATCCSPNAAMSSSTRTRTPVHQCPSASQTHCSAPRLRTRCTLEPNSASFWASQCRSSQSLP